MTMTIQGLELVARLIACYDGYEIAGFDEDNVETKNEAVVANAGPAVRWSTELKVIAKPLVRFELRTTEGVVLARAASAVMLDPNSMYRVTYTIPLGGDV